jgi:hypothetical protein
MGAILRCWGVLLSLALAACSGVSRDFTQSFVDANRGLDDAATLAAYSPEMKLLAVGRESGRLELWDARRTDARIARQAHALRVQGIAFGPEDGIVITSSAFGNIDVGEIVERENGPKVWNARTGELLHAFREDDWLPGAVSATPVRGLYLLASYDELRIYDHARRALVGTSRELQPDGGITAIDWDSRSGLIAAGTNRGLIVLLRLQRQPDGGAQLEIVGSHAPHGDGPRRGIVAVKLLDGGSKLVAVQYLPERAAAPGDGVPPLYRGHQHETARRARRHPYPRRGLAGADRRGQGRGQGQGQGGAAGSAQRRGLAVPIQHQPSRRGAAAAGAGRAGAAGGAGHPRPLSGPEGRCALGGVALIGAGFNPPAPCAAAPTRAAPAPARPSAPTAGGYRGSPASAGGCPAPRRWRARRTAR